MQGREWTKTAENLYVELGSGSEGLTRQQASQALLKNGPNELMAYHRPSTIKSFLSVFLNPLVIVLLIASVISYFAGEAIDAIIIIAIVLVSGLIDLYQKRHVERTIEQLRQKISLQAPALRDGKKVLLPVNGLTVGDIVELEAGQIVPADGRVIYGFELQLDQAVLTGETAPQIKMTTPLPSSTPLADRNNMVYAGTSVVAGEGRMLITGIGGSSELGSIAKELTRARPPTEFERGLSDFSLFLVKIVGALVIFAFFFNSLLHHNFLESFLFAIALALGLTPELLPMIVTINLASGARRLAAKDVLVKDLRSIENFGNLEILCTDKTGTLTESKISFQAGFGYDGRPSSKPLELASLSCAFYSGWQDPLDRAILQAHHADSSHWRKIGELPFDFRRKRSSVAIAASGQRLLIVKGVPESIVKLSSYYQAGNGRHSLTEAGRQRILDQFRQLSAQGQRVLAVATRELPASFHQSYKASEESRLIFVGLLAFIDPPKVGLREVLRRLQANGVEIKILTGDHGAVARRVCEEVGLPISGELTSEDIAKLDKQTLARQAGAVTIFSRLNPEDKERIIASLRSDGKVVGYMGDGINDGLAFRAADLGISVSNAVDVAKEAADMVLLRKDLAVLQRGLEVGRRTHGNVTKYILMNVSSNFGNVLSIACASIFLPFLPALPAQLLLNDFLCDMSILTLPTDTVDRQYLAKPKKWDIGLIKRFMLVFGPLCTIFDLATFVFLLKVLHAGQATFQTGWFVESLVAQVLIIFSIRTRLLPFWRSRPSSALLISSFGIVALAIALPYLAIGQAFNFTALPGVFFAFLAAVVAVYFLGTELTKRWFYHHG